MGHLLPVTPVDTALPGEVPQVALSVKISLPHPMFALAHRAFFPNLIRFVKFRAHLGCGLRALRSPGDGWIQSWLRLVKKPLPGARAMAQWLAVHTVVTEDPRLVPS